MVAILIGSLYHKRMIKRGSTMNERNNHLNSAPKDNAEKTLKERKIVTDMYKVINRQIDNSDPYPLNKAELKNVFYYGYGSDNIRAQHGRYF